MSESADERYSYEHLLGTAQFLQNNVPFKPKIGIICGTGLGALAETLTDKIVFPYETIPNFPVSTVEGHVGQLVFGCLSGVEVVCMQGRFHYFEGYPLWKCAMPVRVMKLIGVTHLIATNAAGGVNPTYKVGDIMLIKDHINMMGFAGNNALHGPNDDRFGPRFPPMNKAYDKELIELSWNIGRDAGLVLHEGVYSCVGGPNFESVAELRMLKILGVDAVGMSTVHEVITARHCNIKVFAFSLITNRCVTNYESQDEANHDSVLDVGRMQHEPLKAFVTQMVSKIAKQIEK